MDRKGQSLVRGRIAKYVLGLCLVVSALIRPEIGFHLPGYLADVYLGPVGYGSTGLTWALVLLAGIGLLLAVRWAGLFAALALVYDLIPGGSGLSFIPFLPALLGALGIRESTGLIVVHAANLMLVVVVFGVQIATVKPRSADAAPPTTLRVAGILSLGVLSGIAAALLIGCAVALVFDLVPFRYRIESADTLARLFLVGGAALVGSMFGVIMSSHWLYWVARFRRQNQENDRIADASGQSESAAGSAKSLSLFSTRPVLLGAMAVCVVASVAVAAWKDANDPSRYGRHLNGLTAWADRIVVRAGGFDCCHPVDGQGVLFEVVDPGELAEVRDHLQFVPGKPSGGCLCCGFPGIDWYRGETRLALTSVQHGFALRWNGFPADACLTEESAQWLQQWLERHGFSEKQLQAIQRVQYSQSMEEPP